jgi:hypothetical protein
VKAPDTALLGIVVVHEERYDVEGKMKTMGEEKDVMLGISGCVRFGTRKM